MMPDSLQEHVNSNTKLMRVADCVVAETRHGKARTRFGAFSMILLN